MSNTLHFRRGRFALFLLLSTAAMLPAGGHAQHSTGLIFARPRDLARIPLAAMPARGTALPAEVDLAANFPTPGHQGNQQSCVAWALSYLKSYQERVEAAFYGRNVTPVFSPAFIYNQVNGGRDGGALIADGLRLLSSAGAAPLSVMPYVEYDYRTPPTPTARAAAQRFRIEQYRQVNVDDTQEVKAHLNAGFPVVIGADIDESFMRLASGQTWQTTAGQSRGGHAMVVVGYSDGRNAFKVINSWGRTWGTGGFGWIDYNHFVRVVREGYVARDAASEAEEDVPLPPPTPAPTPAPAPAAGWASSTAEDGALGIYAHNVPTPALAEMRARAQQGHALTSFAMMPNGAWVLTFGRNGYRTVGTPAGLDSTLRTINSRREIIRRVALSSSGSWIVLRDSVRNWTVAGVPQHTLDNLNQFHRAGEDIPEATFLPDGSLLIIRNDNGWWSGGSFDPELLTAMRESNSNRERLVGGISFGPNGSYLAIRAPNGWYSKGVPPGLSTTLRSLGSARATIGFATLLPNGGWVVFQQRP